MSYGERSDQTVSRGKVITAQLCAVVGLALWGMAALETTFVLLAGFVNFAVWRPYISISMIVVGLATNCWLLVRSNSGDKNIPALTLASILLSAIVLALVAYGIHLAQR